MPVIFNSEKASQFIEEIIKHSEENLSIMLPVFRLTAALFGLLQDAAGRGVRIKIIFGSDELNDFEKNAISELKHIGICCCTEINSKCYSNEKDMIITSVDIHNLYESKNGDISVGISKTEDAVLYEDAMQLYNSIYESSIILISENGKSSPKSAPAASVYHGFCIRCAMPITFNIAKPYCRQCMNQVKEESSNNKPENYCHSCAAKTPTSLSSPQCKDCSNS